MGLELPGWLTEPLGWIGLTWPEADEDKLFEAGQQWVSFGSRLQTIARNANQAAGTVWTDNAGDPVEAFQHWWTRDDGPQPRMAEDAIAAEVIGAALIVFAGLTLALKIAFIAQLIALAIEVAQAIATAFVSFGATTAEIPGFIAATRVFCRQLVKQVVEHIQTVIKEIFEKARGLLKKVASREGRQAGRKAAHELEEDLAKGVPPSITDGPVLPTKPMLSRYEREAEPGGPPFFGAGVRRLDDAQREAHRVYVGEDGLIYKSDGTLFDTRGSNTHWGGPGSDKSIFVMDGHGNLYASKYQEVGVFHHSTLANGREVAGAGEMHVENGRLVGITDNSGHYQPGRSMTQQVVSTLKGRGVDMNGVSVDMQAPEGT